jgi:hypothetical protein
MTHRALMIAGPLSDADLAELLATLRLIEQRNSEGVYKAVIRDLERDPSLEEMADRLHGIFPRLPGQEPDIAIVPRK